MNHNNKQIIFSWVALHKRYRNPKYCELTFDVGFAVGCFVGFFDVGDAVGAPHFETSVHTSDQDSLPYTGW